ncbi:MAG: AI-2E family transporter [Gammaproteobacteria bacterium HGW-Gammaproteobacteria-14]|nr:MAG: AI-2E family transporter [Gammaproteobacteria bacterium HGW-Gammaproteobacteria-14]
MMDVLRSLFRRYFSDEQAVYLFLVLAGGLLVILLFGKMLAPVLAALVIAYLMQGLISSLQQRGVGGVWAFSCVYLLFLSLLLVSLVLLLPMVWKQTLALVQVQLPNLLASTEAWLRQLPSQYPDVITPAQVEQLVAGLRNELADFGHSVVTLSLGLIPGVLDVMIFLVLLPLLVFFFLKDKKLLQEGMTKFLPARRHVLAGVWQEMDGQIANYIRGKALEIVIVGVTTYIVFALMGVKYSLLLAVFVGLSVVVPYVGATVVTLPVMAVAWVQFGWGGEFAMVMLAYGLIQFVDGNILVPLLFSEAVNLHPVVIITAILFFGGLWGFWGVFFAIPLATLIKAVIRAWPNEEVVLPGSP